MNEQALRKYFGRVNEGYNVLLSREGDILRICDSCALYNLSLSSLVFKDRARFPVIPEDGQTVRRAVYSKYWEPVDGRPLAAIISSPEASRIFFTGWLWQLSNAIARVLTDASANLIYVDKVYVDFLAETRSELETFTYWQSAPKGPVRVDDCNGHVLAFIMPILLGASMRPPAGLPVSEAL